MPAVLLSELAARVPKAVVNGGSNPTVTGLTHDSRAVKPGDLYICKRGAHFDGHKFAAQALADGAVAVVVNRGGLAEAGAVLPTDACVVEVADTARALPMLACAFYGDPSRALLMVGVTGTNGKTTTTRMLAAILRAAGRSVGTIGTLGSELDGVAIPSEHTTPEADELQLLLARMRDGGADAVVT